MTGGARALAAEFLGTAGLLATVVGSGIMGERLAQGNAALALLANSLATGLGLYVLVSVFAPLSGAHLNPVVSLAQAWYGALRWTRLPGYLAAQWTGAIAGVFLAHLMFDTPMLQSGTQVRTGFGQFAAEIVATVGLLITVFGFSRAAPAQLAAGVGAYIATAYWFTSSTSFANPAVTTARALTDSFAGIRPVDTLAFISAQVIGCATAAPLFRWLWRPNDSP
jgi:glycerol uptake facilitator-like aquaporin